MRDSGVGGSGDTSVISGQRGWTDRNILFMVALDDPEMASLVTAVKKLHARLATEHRGHGVAFKLFLHACDMIL